MTDDRTAGGERRSPAWQDDWPNHLDNEIESVTSRDGRATINPTQYEEHGTLALDIEWPYHGTTLKLLAIYPDATPFLRPRVQLIDGLDDRPLRHLAPIHNDICLLGRSTSQFQAGDTIGELLESQLEYALTNTGEEDPQGEPSEVWWNALPPSFGAYILIDGAWDLSGAESGTMSVRLTIQQARWKPAKHPKPVSLPVARGIVTNIRNEQGDPIASWNGPVPEVFDNARRIEVPWRRENATVFPEDDPKQLAELMKSLPPGRAQKVGPDYSVNMAVILQPTDLQFGVLGDGWMAILRYQITARQRNQARKGRLPPIARHINVPVYRGAADDLLYRSPAAKHFADANIVIVGGGSIGAPLILELARLGAKSLHVIDHDVVEPGNSVRWPLGLPAWGLHKAKSIEAHVKNNYPNTDIKSSMVQIGGNEAETLVNGQSLEDAIADADLVVDATAEDGVGIYLSHLCNKRARSLIRLFGTANLHGGAVSYHPPGQPCPVCLENTWTDDTPAIAPPHGLDADDEMDQPPGCAERTFRASGTELQELSLEACRMVTDVLSGQLQYAVAHIVDMAPANDGSRKPPMWSSHVIPKHDKCSCPAA